MRIHHIRNATMLVESGERRILIDPMLSPKGAMPSFRFFASGGERNPIVELPEGAMQLMDDATEVLVSHEHLDHIDPPAIAWIKKKNLTVWASEVDAPSLRSKGLNVRALESGEWDVSVEVIPAKHGPGVVGWLLGAVAGFYMAIEGEPGFYWTGDSVMTPRVKEAIARLSPEVIVAPAGSANFGRGPSILFEEPELLQLAKLAPGKVIFNHLEALDHCPTTRDGLLARLKREGLHENVFIPRDGEVVEIEQTYSPAKPGVSPGSKPGIQKWVALKITG